MTHTETEFDTDASSTAAEDSDEPDTKLLAIACTLLIGACAAIQH